MRLSTYFYLACIVYAVAVTFASVFVCWLLWFNAFISPGFQYAVIIDVNSTGEALIEFWMFAGYIFALINIACGWPVVKDDLKSL
jgi:uncharacterized membrane protein